MHPIIALTLFSATVTMIILGVYILLKDRKNWLNINFSLHSFCFAAFLITSLVIYHIVAKDTFLLLMKIRLIFTIFLLAFFFQFINRYTKTFKTARVQVLLMLPALLLVIIVIISDNYLLYAKRIETSWHSLYNYSSFTMQVMAAVDFFYVLTAIISLFIYRKRTDSFKDKKISTLLIFTSSISTLIVLFIEVVVARTIHRNLLSAPFILINTIIIEYVIIFVYKLMNFKIYTLMPEIFSHIREFAVLVDLDYQILETNKIFKDRILDKNRGIKINIKNLIENQAEVSEELATLNDGVTEKLNTYVVYKTGDETVAMDSYISKVKDKFGDWSAILIISKENLGLVQLKKVYKLTQRQLDIMLLSLKGCTNEGIGKALHLHRRTVETHLFNIYK